MASSSSSDIHNNADDFYFSALHDEDVIFPISDEKYAEQLQLQEALISSASQTNASSSSQEGASSSSLQISKKDASSSSLKISEKDASQTNASSSSQEGASSSSLQISKKDASSSSLKISEKDASASSSSIPATSSPSSSLKREQPVKTSEEIQIMESIICAICMDIKATSDVFANAMVCGHQFCSDCIREHISVKIKENIVEVKCPDPECKGLIGPELCRSIVPKEVLDRWEDALCQSLILGAQKFYCPFKDCSAMLVDDGGEAVTSSECPNCNRLFCAQCKVAWHSGMNCSEFKNLKKDEKNPEDIMLVELAKNKKWRRCPECRFFVERLDGCNHISCRCGYQFCYGCGKYNNGSHACNPSDIAV